MRDQHDSLEQRLDLLERRCRRAHALSVATLLVLVVSVSVGFAGNRGRETEVLRARGLIIEDAEGRERILVGAPIPTVPGRKRQDPATGMIFLGENGADRVCVGFAPPPQMNGQVVARSAEAVGMTIHDPEGNERGGFGYLANGNVVLGLDTPDGDAVSLVVWPSGASGLYISGNRLPGEKSWTPKATLAVSPEGYVRLLLDGPDGNNRVDVGVAAEDGTRLVLRDANGEVIEEISE